MSRRDLPDLDPTLYVTTDGLGRADTFIRSLERLIEQPGGGIQSTEEPGGGIQSTDKHDEDSYGHGDDDDPGRIRNHLAHLIGATKEAIREAQYAHSQTVARFEAHRAESERTAEIASVVEVQP